MSNTTQRYLNLSLQSGCAVLLTLVCWLMPAAGQAEIFARGNGCSYLTQSTTEFGGGGTDVLTMRIADDGISSWSQTWGKTIDATPTALAIDSSEAVYVAGNFPSQYNPSLPFDPFLGDIFLLKYNSSGGRQFAQAYNWANFDLSVRDICLDASGNIFLACVAMQLENPMDVQEFCILMKVNASGDEVWTKRLAIDYNEFYSAVTTDGTTVYCAGQWTRRGASWATLVSAYSASDGSLNWIQAWEAAGNCWPVDIELNGWGNLYVAGSLVFNSYPDPYAPELEMVNADALLLCYTTGGSLQWAQHYGSSYREDTYDLEIDTNGDIYLVGSYDFNYRPPVGDVINADPNTDIMLLHFADNGVPLERRSILQGLGSDYKESLYGIDIGPNGELDMYGRLDKDEENACNAIGGFWVYYGNSFAPTPNEDEECGVSTSVLDDFFESSPLGAGDIKPHLTSQGLMCASAQWEQTN